jgi:cell division protein FtsQ
MSSMRARRRAPPPPPPRRRPDISGMPRLAAIKLEGDWRGPPKLTRQNISVFAAGCILFAGAAIAGAAWLGGSLFDARTAFAQQTDSAFTRLGVAASDVRIEGVNGARAAEVRAVVMPEGRSSLLSADPDDVRARVEGLDWVENATVQRVWPATVIVHVTRRAAFARWQENRTVTVIDAAGERLLAERAVDHPELPLVVGAGASHAAAPLLVALEQAPQTQARLAALVRVGERRWNLQMKSGLTVALPETGAVAALQQLEGLQRAHRLLDRPIGTLDLRVPGRLAVRTEPQLLGQEGA